MPCPNAANPSKSRVDRAVASIVASSGVSEAIIRSNSQKRPHSRARWMVWRELRVAGFGLKPIARAWGCDHASIFYAQSKHWGIAPMMDPPVIGGGSTDYQPV